MTNGGCAVWWRRASRSQTRPPLICDRDRYPERRRGARLADLQGRRAGRGGGGRAGRGGLPACNAIPATFVDTAQRTDLGPHTLEAGDILMIK